jgi:hypothetical protein
MTPGFRALIVSTLLVVALPLPLAAQSTESGGGGQEGSAPQGGDSGEGGDGPAVTRPFRGLFGLGDSGRTGASLSGSLFGAYSDNLAATLPGRSFDPRYQRSGWYTGANSEVSVNWRGEAASLNGWGFAGTSYYPDFDNPFVPTYSGGIGFSRPIGRRNSMNLSTSVTYSPYFLNGFYPDVPNLDDLPITPVTPDPNLDVSSNTIIRYSARAGVSRQLSRASTISAGYSYWRSDYTEFDRSYEQNHGSITFQRQLTRHASVHLGYGYRSITNHVLGFPDVTRDIQDIIAGINYNRAFAISMSRRTRVSFSTGSSYVSGSDISGGDFDSGTRSRFYVTGTAEIVHEMGRTWRAAAIYRRSAGFSELVFEPVLSDSISGRLNGLLGRRNEVSVLVSASTGNVGNDRPGTDYKTHLASAQLRRALNRHLAAYVSYQLYKHDFGGQVRLPLGFPNYLDRQGVQFGVNAWLPLR